MQIDNQLAEGKKLYGVSLDYSKVTIKTSRFVHNAPAWSCGNVIRFQQPAPGDDSPIDTATLIHELGHVWQHQSGHVVFLKALWEQLRKIVSPQFDPYNYGGPEKVLAPKRLSDYYTESQAQIICEYWRGANGHGTDRLNNIFTPEYIQNLERLVRDAGIGATPPSKGSLGYMIDSVVVGMLNGILSIFEKS